MSRNPTPPISDLVFTLGMKAGAATTIELVRTYGIDPALDAVAWQVQAELSGSERAILAGAIRQIVSARGAIAS